MQPSLVDWPKIPFPIRERNAWVFRKWADDRISPKIQYIQNLAFCSFRILYIGVLGPQFSQHEVESRTIRMRWWAGWRSGPNEVVSCVGWIMDGPLHGHWLKSWTWGYMWVIVGIWGIYIVGTSRYIEIHWVHGYIYGGSTLWVHVGTSRYIGVRGGSCGIHIVETCGCIGVQVHGQTPSRSLIE